MLNISVNIFSPDLTPFVLHYYLYYKSVITFNSATLRLTYGSSSPGVSLKPAFADKDNEIYDLAWYIPRRVFITREISMRDP